MVDLINFTNFFFLVLTPRRADNKTHKLRQFHEKTTKVIYEILNGRRCFHGIFLFLSFQWFAFYPSSLGIGEKSFAKQANKVRHRTKLRNLLEKNYSSGVL